MREEVASGQRAQAYGWRLRAKLATEILAAQVMR
jgi:hypothetical protein